MKRKFEEERSMSDSPDRRRYGVIETRFRHRGGVAYFDLTINGVLWACVEWSPTRRSWCIQDASGRCLAHCDAIHAENVDATTAVQIAKSMIRDGRMPTPEEAERQLEDRLKHDRLGELWQLLPEPVPVKRSDETVVGSFDYGNVASHASSTSTTSLTSPSRLHHQSYRKTAMEAVLYHVTETKNVRAIRKLGLRRFMPSNWIKAENHERYGHGEIYAFEHEDDALRWAARMDWELHKATGTSKISIIKIAVLGPWEIDHADPLNQAGSKGKWLKNALPVSPEHILEIRKVNRGALRRLVEMAP
jgi:hypothetical protein